MERSPAVAHQFYPGHPDDLADTLEQLIPADTTPQKALAAVVPHAGYIYSGATAGATFAAAAIPGTVILLGPNHHGRGARAALMSSGCWKMPLGPVPIAGELAARLAANCALLTDDPGAHQYEHSLEVQVPFLQHLQQQLAIVPITLGMLSFSDCQKIGTALAHTISDHTDPVLMVASTDMTHYESRSEATRKDRLALDQLLALDPEGLYNTVVGNRISMCGFIPTTITLIAALLLGVTEAKLIRYTDSGETSGDTSRVVGYAGLLLC